MLPADPRCCSQGWIFSPRTPPSRGGEERPAHCPRAPSCSAARSQPCGPAWPSHLGGPEWSVASLVYVWSRLEGLFALVTEVSCTKPKTGSLAPALSETSLGPGHRVRFLGWQTPCLGGTENTSSYVELTSAGAPGPLTSSPLRGLRSCLVTRVLSGSPRARRRPVVGRTFP